MARDRNLLRALDVHAADGGARRAFQRAADEVFVALGAAPPSAHAAQCAAARIRVEIVALRPAGRPSGAVAERLIALDAAERDAGGEGR